jgi:hypothetical protein
VGKSEIGWRQRERLRKVIAVRKGIERGSNVGENLRVVILVFG